MEKSEVDKESEMSIPTTSSKTDRVRTKSSRRKKFAEKNFKENDTGKNKDLIQVITYQNAASTSKSLHSTSSINFSVDVGALLPHFTGHDFDMHIWIQRVDAVQMAYNIPDNVMTVVIAGKLQELAYVWFHSKVEHVSMPWDILKMKLINMFHKSLKRAVTKQFLSRKWCKKERFMDYFFNKIALGTGVGISEIDMIQHVINGFDCPTLQTYSRKKKYNSLQELFKEMQDLKRPRRENKKHNKKYQVENEIFVNMIQSIIRSADSNTTYIPMSIARNSQVITGTSTEDGIPTERIGASEQIDVSSHDEKNASEDNENAKNDNIKLQGPIQIHQSTASSSVNIDFGALLPYFNSQIYDVHVWIQRVDAVQMAYNIPDNVMTVIVAGKLQEFAQIWFYSKVEHNSMPWNILKIELINMFNKESNRNRLMNQFIGRKWVRKEAFTKYYVNKVTLGTGIGIDETNMIEYVIDGFDNADLQNDTKLKNFNSLYKLFDEMRDVRKPKNKMVRPVVQPSLREEIIKNTPTSTILKDSNTTIKNKTESAGITLLSYRENLELAEDFTPVLSDFVPTAKTGTLELAFEVPAGPSSVVQVKKKRQIKKKSQVKKQRPKLINNDEYCNAELCRNVQRILNIITPETFDKHLVQIKNLNIDTIQQMEEVINVIYETAVNVPSYSAVYAHLSSELAPIEVSVYTTKGDLEVLNFKKHLIRKCQLEFEKNIDETERNHKLQEIEACADPVKKKELQLLLDNYDVTLRMRSVGNVLFIGELFKQQMLTVNIIIKCLHDLLGIKNDKNLECLCTLLKATGKELGNKNVELSKIFEELNNICVDTNIGARVRYMIQDVITLVGCGN